LSISSNWARARLRQAIGNALTDRQYINERDVESPFVLGWK
jgi:hypothetical protein